MNRGRSFILQSITLVSLVFTGCGIVNYPGQPGMVTHGYSKLDLEFLTNGLWVYEVSYDNRKGGRGIGVITTKLYSKAQTFTSNVRTNGDGTHYRAKAQYDGAEVQAISIPALNQIMLPPKSQVVFMLDYVKSLDEIDDRNLAEENLFNKDHKSTVVNREALANLAWKWNILRSGTLNEKGNLAYEIMAVEIGDKKYAPDQSITVETNLLQNGLRSNIDNKMIQKMTQFFETHFPKGYSGPIRFHLKNGKEPITANVGLHTIRTAEAAGVKIIRDAREDQIASVLENL